MTKPTTLRALRDAVKNKKREIVRMERDLDHAREDLQELEGDYKVAQEGKGDPEGDGDGEGDPPAEEDFLRD